jgi:hypothetical protein
MPDEINGADAAVLSACDEMPGQQVRTSRPPDIVLVGDAGECENAAD